ncbi:hypothetical protein Y032_0003g1655 [Ancylostoma ceylanicum]|uniref:Uncharacterized protein n=1 Tax=Ancylostoma ceylanicum TaxID=53326 RepID=A0A016VYW5_9BILA|nr:hypothetical protein Y032_0003g1655 [Ancylostoma ceylanicum]
MHIAVWWDICFLEPWAKMKYMVEDLVKRGFKPDRFHSDLPAWPLALPLLDCICLLCKHSKIRENADSKCCRLFH